MPITIGSNIASLRAQRQLGNVTESMGRTFERLSSGMRINRASDDAAGLAIASSLGASRRVANIAIRNVNDGISALSIADAALGQQSGIITRMMELATQAASGTFSNSQRGTMQKEFEQLQQEYFRIAQTASFNGISLLQGGSLNLQVGVTGSDQMITTANLRISRDRGIIDLERNSSNSQRGFDGLMLGFGGATVTREQLDALGVTTLYTTATDDQGRQREIAVQISSGQNNPNQAFMHVYARSLTNPDEWVSNGSPADFAVFSGGGNIQINSDGTFQGLGGSPGVSGNQSALTYEDSEGNQFTIDLSGIRLKNSSAGINPSSDLPSMLDTFRLFSGTSPLSINSAKDSLDGLTGILSYLSSMRGIVGAGMSRLSTAVGNLQTMRENYAAAESRIRDADVAEEAGNLTRLQILQNIGAAILAQANQSPSLALRLLQ